jgi:biopolymer transport protein ExbB
MSFNRLLAGAIRAAVVLGASMCIAAITPAEAIAQAQGAATPAAPAKTAPLQAAAVETLENPYGMEALWKQGDFVARGTLITLMIMSIGSWYIGIVKLWEQRRLMREAREMDAKFWGAKTVKEGLAALHEDSAFRFIAEKGTLAAEHHGGMLEQVDLNTWIGMSLQRAVDTVGNRLQNGLAFLATVGSTAPFVGLFGTVWGIYHALTAIGIAGQASIDKVAGPVGEALIMTALGLAVAVPAVLGYNWLVRRNRVAMELVRHFGGGVHMTLLGGERRARRDS